MIKYSFSAFCLLLLIGLPSFRQALSRSDPGAEEPKTYDQARALVVKTPGYENLRRIGLAFHGYHDIFGRFPPATLLGPDGKTPYSWRVELLPMLRHYVDEIEPAKLREKMPREEYVKLIAACGYDIREPWDSIKNRDMLERIPEVYRHPSDKRDSVSLS